MENSANSICKSVFKTKDKESLSRAFTLKWIELINRIERNKEASTHIG